MCACKYKKKNLNVSKVPCRPPHSGSALLQRNTTPRPPTNLLTILHLQTQNQSFSKLVMVRQHNKEVERQHLLFIRMIEMMNKSP